MSFLYILDKCKKHLSYFSSQVECKTQVVLYCNYCKDDRMNIKFRSKISIAIENALELFQFFQIEFDR